jgi:hypothetical protein
LNQIWKTTLASHHSFWRWFVLLQILLLIALQGLNLRIAVPVPNSADAAGYYAWGESWLDDHDSNPTNQLAGNPLFPVVKMGDGRHVVLDKYPIGWSAAVFPMMAAGDLFNNWKSHGTMGALAPLVVRSTWIGIYLWCIAGILAAYDGLRLLTNSRASACAVALAWLGTSAFAYSWKSPGMSHGVAMSAICLAYWCAIRARRSARAGWFSCAWGVFASIAVCARVFDVVILIPSVFLLIADERFEIALLIGRKAGTRLALAALGGLPLVLFQAWIWHSLYGVWYFNGYAVSHEGFAVNPANMVLFLFSTQKGLFLWHPIVVLALWGLLVSSRRVGGGSAPRVAALLCAAVCVVMIALYGSWSSWSLGDAYGARWTADLFWVWAMGLAFLFSSEKIVFRRALALSVCLSLISLAWIGGQVVNRVPLDDPLVVKVPHWGRVNLP